MFHAFQSIKNKIFFKKIRKKKKKIHSITKLLFLIKIEKKSEYFRNKTPFKLTQTSKGILLA